MKLNLIVFRSEVVRKTRSINDARLAADIAMRIISLDYCMVNKLLKKIDWEIRGIGTSLCCYEVDFMEILEKSREGSF